MSKKTDNFGAVVVAAGMSSRMGSFKPLLPIGTESAAMHIVTTLQRAGAAHIVVVTGYRAEELEAHLLNTGVICIRNLQYSSTQMLDSAKLGLAYLKDRCDSILFTPVDVPLFSAQSIATLLLAKGDIVIPVFSGRNGHPVRIAAECIPSLLTYTGEGGLKGAFAASGATIVRTAVEDVGVLCEMDTPEEYERLLETHGRLAPDAGGSAHLLPEACR